jgi:hypothetical protein
MVRRRKKGGGRKKGVPNKITRTMKEAIEEAYAVIGGNRSLAEWARLNKGDFYKHLMTRLIPKDVNTNLGGDVIIRITPDDAAL